MGRLPKEAATAAGRGDEAALLAWLDSGGKVNATTGSGVTALMSAAARGNRRVVDLLLQRGAEINLQDSSKGYTALIVAAGTGHEHVVDLLLRRGAEINLQSSDGVTALMLAAGTGHEQVVDLLLQRGAAINKQNSKGHTALICAASCNHPAIMSRLLPVASLSDGRSALQYANAKGHRACVDVVRKHLLEREVARKKAYDDIVRAAVSSVGEGGAGGAEGGLPDEIVHAVAQGDEAAVLAWLSSGGDVNATQVFGITLLMLAARSGHAADGCGRYPGAARREDTIPEQHWLHRADGGRRQGT